MRHAHKEKWEKEKTVRKELSDQESIKTFEGKENYKSW